uniref:Uncharacterized protein n=1 Tax=Cannabis sativa TaxID=3483 RepID=A0A803QWS7_CANSA
MIAFFWFLSPKGLAFPSLAFSQVLSLFRYSPKKRPISLTPIGLGLWAWVGARLRVWLLLSKFRGRKF